MTTTRQEAAEARAQVVRAPADRPRQRRCAEAPGAIVASRVYTRHGVELRDSADSGDALAFAGYASVTESAYEMWDMFGPYSEIVSAGAFGKTLAQVDLDVPLVLGHDSMRRIARTTNGTLALSEDETGLLADAQLDPSDADVAYITPKIRSGLIDEMSFRFSITAGQWSPDYTEYRIDGTDINRGDVSIVGYGANPATSVQLRGLAERLQVGRALDAEDVNMLTQAMAWFTAVDFIVDEAQESLSTYLKVPSPDPDDADADAMAAQLAAMTPAHLRQLETGLRAAMRSAGIQPALLLRELLRD